MIKPLGDRVVLEAVEKEEKQPAASFCRTPPKKNRKKDALLRLEAAAWMTMETGSHWKSKKETM